jgi:putative nucleotidyltransferase with HDIG domain
MSPSASDILKIQKVKRGSAFTYFYFLVSIAAVVAIILQGEEVSKPELIGTISIITLCYVVLYFFLLQFRSEVLTIKRKMFFILITIILFLFVTRMVSDKYGTDFILLIPFAIIPVMIRTFYDARLALFILLITILLTAFMIEKPFEFVLMNFISGMVAIFTMTNIYKRLHLFFTALMVIISYSCFHLGIFLMNGGSIEEINLSEYIRFAENGAMILLCYPLILVFEKRFLFMSDTTLLELADTNQPLLRKLAEEAPGSFQHSLQVANLAEEAARVIGANLLLVKAGALYHDIGKIANPKYYIENQKDGVSPHDKLDPRLSARVIINHVKNGVILAKNYKIPTQIIDFIRTHHGTTVAYFFYKKYLDMNPGKTEMKKDFTYPGPKPFSKETAVVMMADAVEASSRSLGDYSEENINDMVERVIVLQEQDGQFSDIPLTYKNISDIKEIFRKRLSNIYHVRVAYPERD